MSRRTRDTVIQFRLEDSYGVSAGAWDASHAVRVINPSFKIPRDLVSRELVNEFMGGSDQLVAGRLATFEFEVELAGSGAAGTAPAWGKLLRACGMAETISAGSRVEYTPVSVDFESGMIRFIRANTVFISKGCRGTVSFVNPAYKIPRLKFMFKGFDTNQVEGGGRINPDYSAFQRPIVLTDANGGDIRIGCNYNDGVVSGGTKLGNRGLDVDLNQKVEHAQLLGAEAVHITDRETTGKMSVQLSAAEEVAWRDEINNNELASLGFAYGTEAGHKIAIYAPSVQRVDPQAEDYQGLHMTGTELRFLPVSGDDELIVAAL